MPAPNKKPPLIDAQTAAFLQYAISINVATRNAENRPAVSRAAGCRVAADGNSLTLFIESERNRALLDNLHANRVLAVVCSRPSTHKTLQLKGNDATIVDITDDDRIAMQDFRASFIEELRGLGYPPAFCEAIVPPLGERHVAIRFTPDLAYSQTPGPNAGKQLPV